MSTWLKCQFADGLLGSKHKPIKLLLRLFARGINISSCDIYFAASILVSFRVTFDVTNVFQIHRGLAEGNSSLSLGILSGIALKMVTLIGRKKKQNKNTVKCKLPLVTRAISHHFLTTFLFPLGYLIAFRALVSISMLYQPYQGPICLFAYDSSHGKKRHDDSWWNFNSLILDRMGRILYAWAPVDGRGAVVPGLEPVM